MYYLKTESFHTDTPVYQKLDGGDNTFFFADARVAKDYATTGLYERDVIRWTCDSLLPSGKDYVDIGAHHGIYTVEMAKKGHVHAFECSPKSFNYLCANIALRDLHYKVTTHNVALGPTTGTTPYYIRDPKDGGGNGVCSFDYDTQRQTPSIQVPMHTLDSYGLSNIGFLKLDVEAGGHGIPLRRASNLSLRLASVSRISDHPDPRMGRHLPRRAFLVGMKGGQNLPCGIRKSCPSVVVEIENRDKRSREVHIPIFNLVEVVCDQLVSLGDGLRSATVAR
jgi:FkbM family methyltransferase